MRPLCRTCRLRRPRLRREPRCLQPRRPSQRGRAWRFRSPRSAIGKEADVLANRLTRQGLHRLRRAAGSWRAGAVPRARRQVQGTARGRHRRRAPEEGRAVQPLDSCASPRLAAALLALSFPRYGHGAVAFIALGPAAASRSRLERTRRRAAGHAFRRGFLLGLLTGVVHFAGTVYWTGATVQTFGGLPWPSPSSSRCCSCSTWRSTSRCRRRSRRRLCAGFGWVGLPLGAAAWVALEYLRGVACSAGSRGFRSATRW